MSKVCQVSGKRPISGNNVSHSNARTRRRFLPNLQKKRIYIQETDQWVTLKLSVHALRCMNRKGAYAYLSEQQKKGIDLGFELGTPNTDWWAQL